MLSKSPWKSYLLFILVLQSYVHAYPFDILRPRADKSSTAPSSALASPASTASGSSPLETGAIQTTSDDSKTLSGTVTTAHETGKSSTVATASRVTTSVIDPVLPAGGVDLQTPATSDGSQYYKIGDYVTFGWNFTSLIVTPTAVNIQAYCSSNAQYYPIASNVSIEDMEVVWNTSEYTQDLTVPFLQAMYTLIIFDESNPGQATAAASAGYLAPFDSYSFAMYSPQPYTPLASGFQCAVCNSGPATFDVNAIRMVLGMGLVMTFSFTWFLCGAV